MFFFVLQVPFLGKGSDSYWNSYRTPENIREGVCGVLCNGGEDVKSDPIMGNGDMHLDYTDRKYGGAWYTYSFSLLTEYIGDKDNVWTVRCCEALNLLLGSPEYLMALDRSLHHPMYCQSVKGATHWSERTVSRSAVKNTFGSEEYHA